MILYKLNEEHKGIEVYFDKKPEQAIIESLKLNDFRWHRKKKCWFAKQNVERLKLAEKIVNGDVSYEVPEAMQELKGIKLGDIFTYSWGYEQTNINCYQVVGFKGQSTVLVREISQVMVEQTSHGMAGRFEPQKDNFISEEVITKRILKGNYLKFDFSYASRWNGNPFYVSWYA